MQPDRTILIAAPAEAKGPAAEMAAVYDAQGIGVDRWVYPDLPRPDGLRQAAQDVDAVLFIVPGRRSPRTLIDGPLLKLADGRQVPVGLLPMRGDSGPFIRAARLAHERPTETSALALLAQRHPRYLRLTRRLAQVLSAGEAGLPVFPWTSDVVIREDMIDGLGSGLGLALYLGHGRPTGLCGYYGLRSHHFEREGFEPLGSLLSICCHTANRRGVGLSFTETMVLQGRAASALGAVSATRHTLNTRWAVQLAEHVGSTHTVGDLLRKALPLNPVAAAPYRLIGDPLAPLHSSRQAVCRAQQTPIYA